LLVACAPKARSHAPSKTGSGRAIFIPELSRRQTCRATRLRDFREWERRSVDPLRKSNTLTSSQEITGMFPSHKHLSAGPVTRLGSAVVIAAFAVVTIAEAGGTPPAQSASAESRPASNPALQALILRDRRDIDYSRVDGFEGMLSDFVCGS
jgi:hypothetical protein